MRGRRKPIGQQIAEGDPRKVGKNKLRERLLSEPQSVSGYPPCPRHLRGRERSTWQFWAEQIAIMNLDKRPDAQMLEGACIAYARAVKADVELNKTGLIIHEPIFNRDTGVQIGEKLKAHPAVAISRIAWNQVRSFATEFGLSPVSRTRLAHDKPDSKMPDLTEILSGPREKRAAVN